MESSKLNVTVDIVSASKLGPDNGPLEVELPSGSTVGDLLSWLIQSFGEPLRKRLVHESDGTPFVIFVVNGEKADLSDGLYPGDSVLIVPPIGGG
jgi:molybdopterin converting factor small subunit